MSNARHVTPGATAARLANIRKLIVALQVKALRRDEIGDLLKVGPSGVRKYLADLRGKVEMTINAGEMVCRLTICESEAQVYLATLAVQALARPAKKPASPIDAAGAGRRFHILADDTYHAIRVNRSPAVRDPLVAAFFGAARMEVRA